MTPKSPNIYKYFNNKQTELNDTLLYEAKQQDKVIRQLFVFETLQKLPSHPRIDYPCKQGIATLLSTLQKFKRK